MIVGARYSVFPKSDWARRMVREYGNTLKLGKIDKQHIMFVNDECSDVDDYDGGDFAWGFWVNLDEIELIGTVS